MKKVNFDSLSQLKTPQAWLEKAADVPSAPVLKMKKRTLFTPYRVAAAASIVLVSVIGLTVLLFHDSGNAPVVIRNSATVATQPYTDAADHDEMTQASADPAQGDGSTAAQEHGTTVSDSTVPTDVTDNAPSEAATASATAPTAAAERQTGIVPSATTASQSASTDSKPSNDSDPTAPPSPTTAPTVPHETAESMPPTEPTKPYIPPKDFRIYAVVPFLPEAEEIDDPAVANDAVVFCCLYTASWNTVGSMDYTWEKTAEVLSVNPDGSYNVMYDPVAKGLHIESGRYEYVFYDLYGTELYRGTVEY